MCCLCQCDGRKIISLNSWVINTYLSVFYMNKYVPDPFPLPFSKLQFRSFVHAFMVYDRLFLARTLYLFRRLAFVYGVLEIHFSLWLTFTYFHFCHREFKKNFHKARIIHLSFMTLRFCAIIFFTYFCSTGLN
jgi:hypothetical protein